TANAIVELLERSIQAALHLLPCARGRPAHRGHEAKFQDLRRRRAHHHGCHEGDRDQQISLHDSSLLSPSYFSSMAAKTSISTMKSFPASLETSTSVPGDMLCCWGLRSQKSGYARAAHPSIAFKYASMSVTKIRLLTTSFKVAPSVA